MAPLFWDVRARLGDWLYAVDTPGLEGRVLQLLKERRLTFSAAESCTGGLIAKRITDLSGASAVFRGGRRILYERREGGRARCPGGAARAVHRCLRARRPRDAEGVRALTGSDLAVSVTGVAGPGPDDDGHPEGLVYAALTDGEHTWVRRLELGTGRGRIRVMAAHHAFDLLRRYLTQLPITEETEGE